MKQITEKELNAAFVEMKKKARQRVWTPYELSVIKKAYEQGVPPLQLYKSWEKITGEKRGYDSIRNQLRLLAMHA